MIVVEHTYRKKEVGKRLVVVCSKSTLSHQTICLLGYVSSSEDVSTVFSARHFLFRKGINHA